MNWQWLERTSRARWGIGAGVAAAAVTAAGSIASSEIGSSASKDAAKSQQAAAAQAEQTQKDELSAQQALVAPNVTLGQWSAEALGNQLGITPGAGGQGQGVLTQTLPSWSPTEEQLQSTPGYQFTKQQGLEAAQNGFAAQGLASSGAAVKGATSYAEGLADTTYQQQFSNYLSTNQQTMANEAQIAGLLGNVAGSGQNAALGLGSLGSTAAGNTSSEQLASGAAQAAGTVGAANATSSGLSSAFSNLGSGVTLSSLLGQQSGDTSQNISGISNTANSGSSYNPNPSSLLNSFTNSNEESVV